MCKSISPCWRPRFPTEILVNLKGGAKIISDLATSEESNSKQTPNWQNSMDSEVEGLQ